MAELQTPSTSIEAPQRADASARPGPSPVPKVLVIDDQPSIRELLSDVLADQGHQTILASGADEALAALERHAFDAVLVDIVLEEPESGLNLLPKIRETQPLTPSIVISGEANMHRVMGALKAGAYDFLCKPFSIAEVQKTVANAIEKKRMAEENARLMRELRIERDGLERRVEEATRDLAAKVHSLQSLNEQVSTLFEMSQARSVDGPPSQVLDHIITLLRNIVPLEGAFCLMFDLNARDFNLVYGSDARAEAVSRGIADRVKARRGEIARIMDAAAGPPAEEAMRGAFAELAAQACPDPERALIVPLHVPGLMMGVFGAINTEHTGILDAAEERMLSFAISNFLAIVHERNFLNRTSQLEGFGELVTEIAHDLRHPMTSLRGAAKILSDHWRDDSRRERCLKVFSTDLTRMECLVAELVNFYRSDKFSMIPMDLNQLLDKALDVSRSLIEEHGIEVERDYDEGSPVVLGLSRNLIESFVNLISNAIHAMEEGGRLTLETGSRLDAKEKALLDARGRRPDQYVRARVIDTGTGIAPENIEKIFTRFFTTRPEGHGLGLAAVHRVLKKNLGEIEVESELGRGTAFSVYLPRA